MKKMQRQRLIKLMFISFVWFGLVQEARADTTITLLREIRNAAKSIVFYVNSILTELQSAGDEVFEALTAKTPEFDEVTQANTHMSAGVLKQQYYYEEPLTFNAVTDLLTNSAGNLQTSSQALLDLPGPDFPSYQKYEVKPIFQLNTPAGVTKGPSPFNLDTLLGKVAFSESKSQLALEEKMPVCENCIAAQGFIGYISGLANPPMVPSFSKLKSQGVKKTQVEQFRSTAKVKNYLAELRSYTAAQSVGLNNFYHLYAERMIQKGLGATLKPSQPNKAGGQKRESIPDDVSSLQAEQYLATRRVNDPNWYISMETASSPLTLARETLYILAEIRSELFKTRLENERLLAAISALQLQGLKFQKPLLDQQASGIDLPKPSSAAASVPQESTNAEQVQSQLSPEQQKEMKKLQE